MGLLNKILKKSPPMPVVREDVTLGDPDIRRARLLAQKSDWQSVRQILGSTTDRRKRAATVSAAAEERATDRWSEEWIAAFPDEADAWFVRGARSVTRAYDIRGASRADDVPEARWEPFYASLEQAEDELFKGAELAPADSLPWKLLLSVSLGLGHPIEERIARFEEGAARVPDDFSLHHMLLTCLTKKWGGSHELMFDFARSAAEAQPSTMIPVLIPFAHVERWLGFSMDGDAKGLERYFRSSEVRKEILDAHAKTRAESHVDVNIAANFYAFTLWKLGEKKLARGEFEKAAGLYSGIPWCYVGDDEYRAALSECW